MFDIYFETHEVLNEKNDPNSAPFLRGEICIGGFRERFRSSIYPWGVSDYEDHWIESASRIVSGCNSAFITDFALPQQSSWLIWWPAYTLGNKVVLQNHMLFFKQLELQFDIDNMYEHIPNHEYNDYENRAISSWETSIDSFRDYLSRRSPYLV